MIEDVANDFDMLEYSPTTAGAVLDTLALVSGREASMTSDSKVTHTDDILSQTLVVLPLILLRSTNWTRLFV